MKIGILINARCGSKRLKDKHFKTIAGKPAINYLIDRLPHENLFLATGGEKENYEFSRYLLVAAYEHKIKIYFGDPDNIPIRHLALAEQYKLDAVVSVDGDDLLTSPTAVRDAAAALKEGHDLVRTEGLPLGMNVLWGYTTKRLLSAIRRSNAQTVNDTNWGWIFDAADATPDGAYRSIKYAMPPGAESIRATLDTPEDLEFFRWVFANCPSDIRAHDRKLCEWIMSEKEAWARQMKAV